MSKNNTKSVVEITEDDIEMELDEEYRKEMLESTRLFHKECDLNSKCINIISDMKTYLDGNSVSDKICVNMTVEDVKQLLSEIYS